jgi:methylase of polypeptide subunit release factors
MVPMTLAAELKVEHHSQLEQVSMKETNLNYSLVHMLEQMRFGSVQLSMSMDLEMRSPRRHHQQV